VLEIIKAGGWLMIPILLCSLVSVAIVVERLWSLGRSKILPSGLLRHVWDLYKTDSLTMEKIMELRTDSPLGEVFAAGFVNQVHGREVMKDAMEEAGSKVAHDMERFLAALGTIAAVAPLLGLLGTVVGMISVFNQIMISGTGDANLLAGGISTALNTTAAGLAVAIPSMMFHRYFERQIDGMVVDMEHQCSRLVDAIYSGKALNETVDKATTVRTMSTSASISEETDNTDGNAFSSSDETEEASLVSTPAGSTSNTTMNSKNINTRKSSSSRRKKRK